MNIFSIFEDRVREAVAALVAEGVFAGQPDLGRVVVEPPKDPSLGDFATNAAMVLVRETSLKPRELADRLAAHLRQAPGITGVEVAGPGFINIRAEVSNWYAVLRAVLELGADYGRGADKPGKVNVEYVSANPTGPMHVGHCRGAVVGDALASLLAFAGREVTREYYTNDAGAQVEVLARSAYLRYREALGETVTIPEGLYPGDYLKPVGEHLAAAYGRSLLDKPEADWLETVRTIAVDQMMALIREDLALLKVNHDVFFSERSLQTPIDIVGQTIEALRQKGDVYEGTLPRPKGDAEDWEEREQTLFRATAYGDDVDRPLKKSDGSYTYFASDIAYHKNKFDRGFAEMIDIWGADHGGYVKRMTSAVKAVTGGKGNLDVKISQLVKLMRDGQPVKMSKRSGDFVTLREVVEEVGSDAVRFMMLMRKSDATLDFDLAKVIEQSKDNPVFYVQYAHARCRSTFRSAAATRPLLAQPDWFLKTDVKALDDEGELLILRRLAQYPRLIEQAAQAHEAHRVSFYLYELASDFHAHWNRGKDLPRLRFIREEDEMVTLARLALVRAVETVLASGLSLLGVGAPEEMR